MDGQRTPWSWRVGRARITRVVEIEGRTTGPFILPDATPEAMRARPWLAPRFADAAGDLIMSIHALVVESQGLRIVVDTCVGNDKRRKIPEWNGRHGPFLGDLARAGLARETIDIVVCTHLHVDHVGWNTMLARGRWIPTFPRARYLFVREEWEHWSRQDASRLGDAMADSIRPVVDAGLVERVAADHRITDEVSLEATPGHTPGHVSVRIRSSGDEAVITGDLMHHPVQCDEPEWRSPFDSDPDLAERTRFEFLTRCADTDVRVIGTHFATPTIGRIAREGRAFRFRA